MNCKLCGSSKVSGHFKVKGYEVFKCLDCGLMSLGGLSIDSGKLYSEPYFNGEVYNDYINEMGSNKAEFRTRLKLVNGILPSRGKLLEIGCAAGFFLKTAKDDGWDVKGIEVSEYAADFGRARLGLDIVCGDIDSLEPGHEQFDAVVMWDVIEHIKDPFGLIRKVRPMLRPGGALFVSTGDTDGLNARIFGKDWFLLEPPYHLWYFSRRNFRAFLERNGYKVKSCSLDGNLLDNGPRNAGSPFKLIKKSGANRVFSRFNIGNVFYMAAEKT
ncbi:Ubiquinone biosynthesis O-methyltransferase [uncultured bacterium]|nr:Ubiquinone biosynthesis O-methyltransferase [uncultured bacterium]